MSSDNKNLIYLLNKRFSWMKKYIKRKKIIIELGSGNGCIKKVIDNKKIILTDIIKYPWIDKKGGYVENKSWEKIFEKSRYFYYKPFTSPLCQSGFDIKKDVNLSKKKWIHINKRT